MSDLSLWDFNTKIREKSWSCSWSWKLWRPWSWSWQQSLIYITASCVLAFAWEFLLCSHADTYFFYIHTSVAYSSVFWNKFIVIFFVPPRCLYFVCIWRRRLSAGILLWVRLVSRDLARHLQINKGPFKNYVTLFFRTFWPPSPLCHIASHLWLPPSKITSHQLNPPPQPLRKTPRDRPQKMNVRLLWASDYQY